MSRPPVRTTQPAPRGGSSRAIRENRSRWVQKFTKICHTSLFPYFIISDGNFSNFWLRCNEDLVCCNPSGFRIAMSWSVYQCLCLQYALIFMTWQLYVQRLYIWEVKQAKIDFSWYRSNSLSQVFQFIHLVAKFVCNLICKLTKNVDKSCIF